MEAVTSRIKKYKVSNEKKEAGQFEVRKNVINTAVKALSLE